MPPYNLKPMKGVAREIQDLKDLDFKNWWAEEKLDGARYFLHITRKGCRLLSPHVSAKDGEQVDKTDRVPHITQNPDLQAWYEKFHGTVLDGEITVTSDVSKSRLVTKIMGSNADKALERQKESGLICFKVFDCLYQKGESIQEAAQNTRRIVVEKIVNDKLNVTKSIDLVKQQFFKSAEELDELYSAVLEKGGEGLMLKNMHKPYLQKKRYAHTWIKMKRLATYDAIVTGYKAGTRKYTGTVGALRISQYCDGKLIPVGFIGGMTDALRHKFAKMLEFDKSVEPKQVVKVDKKLWFIVEFQSQEPEEKSHKYRHGRFERIRTDKRKDECLFGEK